ncbi:hypothetical protein K449DRAFT_467197 [Hypoxylon sp. EC38]|nr:hypothetical protein K449DRAFT_467197 [Hypoxylon sp. EC38]
MHLTPSQLRQEASYFEMDPGHVADADFHESPVDFDGSYLQQSPELAAQNDHLLREDSISLDARRLQAQHITEGYRDGITAGKAESIQAGFDEGFSIGAHIGLEAGRILGLLDGVANSRKECGFNNLAPTAQLLRDAKLELSIKFLFSEHIIIVNK